MKKAIFTTVLTILFSWTANAGESKNRLSYGFGFFSIKVFSGVGYERLLTPNQSLEVNLGVDPFYGVSSSLSYNYIVGDKNHTASRCLIFLNCKKWDKFGFGVQRFSSWNYEFGAEGSTERRVYSVGMKDWGLLNWESGAEFSFGIYTSVAFTYKSPLQKTNPKVIEGSALQTDIDFINSLKKPSVGMAFNIGIAL
ncbi:MAG: hypothetical protein RJB66_557 [Pseudomonadota bacterium]|jgi:hypothetical protein